MIGWLLEENTKIRQIDFSKLKKVMANIKINNKYAYYLKKLYLEYQNLENEKSEDIFKELHYPVVNHDDLINKKIILSDSHIDTYYIIKRINVNKEKLTVICFDMHSDTYNYRDKLWKGNSFSKLLKEKYITNFIVIGIPNKKQKATYQEIDDELKKQIYFTKAGKLKKLLKKINSKNVFISIDIDCFDTRKMKCTALEYCPMTILNYLSHMYIKKINKEKLKNAIYIKNDLGYANMWKVGENKITFKKMQKYLENIAKISKELNINLGIKSYECYADITELKGYDFGNRTKELVINLIDELLKMEVKK